MRKSLLTDSSSDEASELPRNVLNEGKRSEPERSESERSGWNERDGAEALLRGAMSKVLKCCFHVVRILQQNRNNGCKCDILYECRYFIGYMSRFR